MVKYLSTSENFISFYIVEEDIPDHIKPLLMEPVLVPESHTVSSPVQDLNTPPQSPTSPCSDEEGNAKQLNFFFHLYRKGN